MASRLAGSTSTYLAQHADQPVDWWPWSEAAFEFARDRDVPVMLSVGYASCHWCHVMAHESFSDPATAEQLNAGFVPIKVDREERPDVDAVYMSATQALTGSGGWPMTCFLTPDARPFYAGTYYPPEPASGLPSFRQLPGRFSRYSVDRTWHVPHFEKMLDDNAQLLRLYAHHRRLTGSALSGRVTGQIAEFLLRDLRLPSGAFAASLDADTNGVEGATYRWTRSELVTVLGQRDGADAATLFALPESGPGTPPGAAPGDRADPDELAAEVLRLPVEPADPRWFDAVRRQLLAVRDRRPQPARDDIVVLRSNGLAITALAEAGATAGRPEWIDAGQVAADHVLAVHRVDGRWYRSSRDGRVGPGRAVLADLGDLATGLLTLYQATGQLHRLHQATDVIDDAVLHFADRAGVSGAVTGFFDTADDAGPLILRPRDPTDGAVPSGLSSITHALLTAAALTGNRSYRTLAEAAVSSVAALLQRYPRSAGWQLSAAESLVAGPLQIAVAGPDGPARADSALD